MIEMPETHQRGFILIHNQELIDRVDLSDADFGLQISSDGRVWVCIDGIAFIRFKPSRNKPERKLDDQGTTNHNRHRFGCPDDDRL